MKFLTVLILTFTALLSIAQSDNNPSYNIDWTTPVDIYQSGKVLDFNGASHQDGLPIYTIDFKKKYLVKATITDAVYTPITGSEKNLIPVSFNQNEIKASISYGKDRKTWVSKVSFTPVRNNNGTWEKLIAFNLTIEKGNNPIEKTGNYDWKNTSVFSTGTWYKIGIPSSGIYKIDPNFIQSLGLNINNINPKNMRIYGNGGEMLPQLNSETWYDDVSENAIYVKGESDGKFDATDYALFYAKGPVSWQYDTVNTIYKHEKNLYSDTAYYFITFSLGAGKRVQAQADLSGSSITLNTFNDYFLHEKDEVNTKTSGRHWFGEKFDFELTKTFNFTAAGIKSSPGVTVSTRLGTESPLNTNFQVSLNNSTLGTMDMTKFTNSLYPTSNRYTKNWVAIATSSSNLAVKLVYNKSGSTSSIGYCDFITLNFDRDLKLYGNQTSFRSIKSINHNITKYQVGNAINATIWDITDITNAKSQNTAGSSTKSFSQNSTELKEYIIFKGSTFPSPSYKNKVTAQNLHALSTPDFVIITEATFMSEANRLAQHRREKDGFRVHVVEVNKIYNEFSSGKQDVGAIRNFMKMFYDRNDGSKLKYLLLFGDCSYDYKNKITNNTNFVPVYESRNSDSPITSYSSDDFYALLDDIEGIFCELSSACILNEYLDIGVGRIPSKTIEEAKGVIDKIIHYDEGNQNITSCNNAQSYTSGKWRNEIVLIGDDEDGNAHLKSVENHIYPVLKNYPDYHINKIYIDAYEQFSGAGGQTAPKVKAAINANMKRGALIFNYSGHGGELGLSHEGVISVPQINAWDNFDNMPLMFTATCEFGRYDDPARTSGGELTMLNPKGGTIAIVTTTRPVYSTANNQINKTFFKSVFEPLDTITGRMPRLGDVMRSAKNGSQSSSNVNNRNFALLGDPSLMLSYPKEKVILTAINNYSVMDTFADTLSALEKITMEGEVRNASGSLMTNFDGVLEASIYDKLNIYRTLGDKDGYPQDFDARDIKIFEGLASIKKGKFKFSFIVPKDIKYTFGNGKAIFYAASETLKTNGHGSDLSFIVGGTADNIEEDLTPPEISLYMNDETFVFGGTTGESATFLAKLFDTHGINTTGVGIGHELSSVLDGNMNNTLILNDFYTSELDDYQKGIIKYPLEDLQPGNHKITLKAWDTYNNSNEEYLEFLVINEENLSLQHILNYPNPFTTNTEFHFDHNRACDDLEIRIQVFTVSGRLIKTINTHFPHADAHISKIFWDGKDDYGDNIGRGVYVYKVKVRSLTDGSQVHQYQKLVILK